MRNFDALKKTFYGKVLLALTVVLLAVGAGLTLPSASYAQSVNWSQAVPLSPDGEFAWFPDVAVDALGQVHVVWSAGSNRYDTVMYTTSKNGQEWSKVNDIFAFLQVAGSEASRPGLFIDRYDLIHMAFRSTTVYYSEVPAGSAYDAHSWLAPEPVSGAQVAYFSRVARDSQDTLHLVFTENVSSVNCPICYHVFYRRSDNNGLDWTPPVDISRLLTGAGKVQLLIDDQDNLHLVWEAGRGGSYGQLVEPTKVMYAASYDRGAAWTNPTEMGLPDVRGKAITIGLGRDGNLVAVWLSVPEDKVYYRVSADQGHTWSSAEPIPGVWGGWSKYPARLDDYATATDSAGDVHLIAVGRTAEDQGSLSVLHLTWNGSSWSAPDVLTTLVGDVPEWPRIAIGNGNQLHVVWYVRDQKHIFGDSPDGSAPQFRVWYAQGLSSAPEVKSDAVPLPTATPEPQLVTDSALTPPPSVATAPGQTPIPTDTITSTNTEADGLLLLLKSLLPVAALIAVLFIGVRMWRR